MKFDLSGVNWMAVGVTAVAVFLLGAVWYAALFAKPWQRLHGYSDEKVAQMRKDRPPPVFFGVMIASYLIFSAALAVLIVGFDVRGWMGGLSLGGLLWLMVALPNGLTAWVSSDKPMGAFAIDWAYQLVFMLMAGGTLASWR